VGITQLKRKLRDLKKVEKRVRFGKAEVEGQVLVWSRFFSTERLDDETVKYPLSALLPMDRAQLKCVLEEYFYCLYYEKYKEAGITLQDVFDPALLSMFDLPPSAGLDDVKRRFRELAKRYHPDHGGDGEKMIEVLDTYRRLTVDAGSTRASR